jgi:hypothetical protein
VPSPRPVECGDQLVPYRELEVVPREEVVDMFPAASKRRYVFI